MSKRNSWGLLILLLLVVNEWAPAQKAKSAKAKSGAKSVAQTKATTVAAANSKAVVTSEQVAAMTDEVMKQVSEIRGLQLLHPVKSGAKSRAEIEAMVVKSFNEEMTPEEIRAEAKTMEAFGLIPKGFKYREFIIKLLTEQIAGFYDPKIKEFHLADWNALEMQKPVMAHELTHVLQDQHFNLLRFDKWPKADGDRETAIHALIEGDALAVMIDYLMRPMGQSLTKIPAAALTQITTMMSSADMPELKAAPNVIRESLIFPYSYGLIFTAELVKDQQWQGVSAAYEKLPQSTEQILHYAKYKNNELPVKITLADAVAAFGAGWKTTNKDTHGEFGYYLTLAEFLDKEEARKAADGWGGDQYALYENAAKTAATLVHLSAWDSDVDAQEFFHAYSTRTAKRYPQSKVNSSAGKIVYGTPEGETLIELRAKNVLVIEGATAGKAEGAAAKLWESGIGKE